MYQYRQESQGTERKPTAQRQMRNANPETESLEAGVLTTHAHARSTLARSHAWRSAHIMPAATSSVRRTSKLQISMQCNRTHAGRRTPHTAPVAHPAAAVEKLRSRARARGRNPHFCCLQSGTSKQRGPPALGSSQQNLSTCESGRPSAYCPQSSIQLPPPSHAA